MTIEQHIDELRAELRNAYDAIECRELQAELVCAEAELAVIIAEQDGSLDLEPPF